jgi:SnoaL-like domain
VTAPGPGTSSGAIADLVERNRIADLVTTLFVATDAREWERVRRCFAARVIFDMTSLAGGEPAELFPEQITDAWDAGLKPIESVHHQVGNLAVTCSGVEATASCYGIAYHHRSTTSGRNTRLFVGSYDFHLQRTDGEWRIDLFRFNLKFIDGNRDLEKEPAG